MEVSTTESSGGGGGGVPVPFIAKTYEMVDDPSTNEIISWSTTNNSFIVWNPTELCCLLLCKYFKHSNFHSFIRQLNIYGFRKINHDIWEFANESFVRDQHHLLIRIHRKKTTHCHSIVDLERLEFEEEIKKLVNEKAYIESHISTFNQYMSTRKFHMGNLQLRLDGIEQRQKNLTNLFQRVLQNPKSTELIYRKIRSENLIGYNKKRRFPHVAGNSFVENDNNFGIMQVGNEDGEGASNKIMCKRELPKETQTIATLGFISGKEESILSYSPPDNSLPEGEKRLSSEQKSEESDRDQTCCLLNPTPTSSLTQDRSSPKRDCQEIGDFVKSRLYANDKESDDEGSFSNRILADATTNLASSQKSHGPSNKQEISIADGFNCAFWSQYLIDED